MKKLLAALTLSFGLCFGTAQTTHPATSSQAMPHAKTTTVKKAERRADGKTAAVKPTTTTTVTTTPAGVKLKADGTPDRRYKEAQKLKKDGTPDKRYKANK